jgi:hypothetical protein
MTIEIKKPELEAILQQRLAGGQDVEEVLLEVLRPTPIAAPLPKRRKRLIDALTHPAFAGSELTLERPKEYSRPIEL